MGMTSGRDGWRFEPLRNRQCLCEFRGQITPQSARLVYEVFVESLVSSPEPRVVADVVCSLRGRPIFHARRLGLGLVPDWPLSSFVTAPGTQRCPVRQGRFRRLVGLPGTATTAHRPIIDGEIESDFPAMLAFAWGRAQDVFGRRFIDHDGARRWPRVPGPPLLFLTRITKIEADMMKPQAGAWIESEYDVLEGSWFFNENGYPTMPFVVLLEAALQPSGWLMFYVVPEGGRLDYYLRNLDGTATVYEELPQGCATLRVRAEFVSTAQLGGTRLFTTALRSFVGTRCISEIHSTFGLFPSEALQEQAGVPVTPEESERIAAPGGFYLDLTAQPARYFTGSLRLPGTMLRMIDRVTALDPGGAGWASVGFAQRRTSTRASGSSSRTSFRIRFSRVPLAWRRCCSFRRFS